MSRRTNLASRIRFVSNARAIALTCAAAAIFAGCLTPGADPNTHAAPSPGANIAPTCTDGACITRGACEPGRASAQFRTQVAPPSSMAPGTRAWVSVTYDNCSGRAWDAREFVLAPRAPATSEIWGVVQVPVPVAVPDGARVTIPFEITAPDRAGSYAYAWGISHVGVGVLQEPSPTLDVNVVSSADCTHVGPAARVIEHVEPEAFVATGGAVHGSVTLANCSPDTWRRADGCRLGSQSPQDNDTWGVSRMDLPQDVPPGGQVTIAIDARAPREPGRYRWSWQLVREGHAWLGEASPETTIVALHPTDCSVVGPNARFRSEVAPTNTVDPRQGFDVRVTFGNCSGQPWSADFRIAGTEPGIDAAWSPGRVTLPLPVGSGFEIDVPFHVTAPAQPGRYGYQWAVTPAGGVALREASERHEITVRCIPQCDGRTCGGDGCGGTCGSCASGWSCDGAHCQPPVGVSCGHLQWWNSALTYEHWSGAWRDTDLAVRGSTPVQLRHESRLDRTGVYGWGYMPEFTDLVTGHRFKILHLRPSAQWATDVGRVYPAGFVVGLSGGDTVDTGLGPYSTGAHLCIQTLEPYRTVFPTGVDPCH